MRARHIVFESTQLSCSVLEDGPPLRQNPVSPTENGTTLVELLMVLVIGVIATAMTVPLIMTTVNQYRLHGSAVDMDSLLQRARMRAVKDNRTYTVQTATVTESGATYTKVFLDLNGNSTLDQGEPVIQLQRGVSLTVGSSGGNNPSLSATTLGFTPQGSNVPVNFNARGTPCVVNGSVCSSWDSKGASPSPVGFIYYLQSTGGTGAGWSAISISPSGRFRAWSYDKHTGTWSY